jgi:hypothetical protein
LPRSEISQSLFLTFVEKLPLRNSLFFSTLLARNLGCVSTWTVSQWQIEWSALRGRLFYAAFWPRSLAQSLASTWNYFQLQTESTVRLDSPISSFFFTLLFFTSEAFFALLFHPRNLNSSLLGLFPNYRHSGQTDFHVSSFSSRCFSPKNLSNNSISCLYLDCSQYCPNYRQRAVRAWTYQSSFLLTLLFDPRNLSNTLASAWTVPYCPNYRHRAVRAWTHITSSFLFTLLFSALLLGLFPNYRQSAHLFALDLYE